MLQIHAMNSGMFLRLVTERDIYVSYLMRVVLPIGRRRAPNANGRSHAHVPGMVAQPENFYTRRNSQSHATHTQPITWLLLLLSWLLGSLREPEYG